MSQEQIEALNARETFFPTEQAERIRGQVEQMWTHVMNRILPGVTPNRVDLFGSQYYRLHTPTSDIDCAVVLAQEYMHLARELLLCMALRLGETFHLQEGSAQPNYQNANHTLKWTHRGDICTSLLVDTEEHVASSKNASVVLRRYFDAHEEYIDPVRTLITSLRAKKCLNPRARPDKGLAPEVCGRCPPVREHTRELQHASGSRRDAMAAGVHCGAYAKRQLLLHLPSR